MAALERIVERVPADRVRVGVFGSVSFYSPQSEALCRAIGEELGALPDVVLLTGGNAIVHEVIATSFQEVASERGDALVLHMLPYGVPCAFACGERVDAGAHMSERRALLAAACHVAIVVEGGPGTSDEMHQAVQHGTVLIPLARSGGASSGMFDAPPRRKPSFATDEQWSRLSNEEIDVRESARAVVDIIRAYIEQRRT